MALSNRKLFEKFEEEINQIPKRCDGYHDMLYKCIKDIISEERVHLIQNTWIQNKVDDLCDNLGENLNQQSSE